MELSTWLARRGNHDIIMGVKQHTSSVSLNSLHSQRLKNTLDKKGVCREVSFLDLVLNYSTTQSICALKQSYNSSSLKHAHTRINKQNKQVLESLLNLIQSQASKQRDGNPTCTLIHSLAHTQAHTKEASHLELLMSIERKD